MKAVKIEKGAKNLHTLQAHQVDLVTIVVTIVAAQVMVETKLVFLEERLMKGWDEIWKL